MEYTAIRNQASLYDLSPMVKYRIAGPDAAAFLDRLTIRNVAKLPVDAVHYTAWCDDAGHLLDDGTLFRHGAEDFLLCCQERHLPWLLDSATGFDAHIEEVTEAVAALSLQGPTSAAVLRAAGVTAVETLKPFRLTRATLAGIELTVSRTGFTGDLGYELWTTPDRALELWDTLMAAGALHGLRPIGTNALNLARIEAGFIITGMDFVPADTAVRADRARSPFELGLDWMIDWQKGHFTGRRALLAEKRQGLHLVPRRPRHRRQRPGRPRHRLPREEEGGRPHHRRRLVALDQAQHRARPPPPPLRHPEHRPLGRDLRPARAPVRQADAPRPRHRRARSSTPRAAAPPRPPTSEASHATATLDRRTGARDLGPQRPPRLGLPQPGLPRASRRPSSSPPTGRSSATSATCPRPASWVSLDIGDDRALVIRGQDGMIRAVHNLCRHRGARVAAGDAGQCRTPSSARSTAGSTTSTAPCAARPGRRPSRATSTAASTA